MTFYQKDKIYIPTEWNGKQALAVWEFLEEIAATIWEVHEEKILKASNSMEPTPEIPEPEDDGMYADEDDIPF
jgi:hypothetical protein